MTTFNHAFWGATIGRTIGMPYEGALMGALPDVLSIPILAYYHKFKDKKMPAQLPKWAWYWYSILHNWNFSFLLIICLYLVHPSLWVLGFAFFWHGFEDAFCHRTFASSFLYPLWKRKIKMQKYTASENPWIQVIDILLMLLVNVLISIYHIRLVP